MRHYFSVSPGVLASRKVRHLFCFCLPTPSRYLPVGVLGLESLVMCSPEGLSLTLLLLSAHVQGGSHEAVNEESPDAEDSRRYYAI